MKRFCICMGLSVLLFGLSNCMAEDIYNNDIIKKARRSGQIKLNSATNFDFSFDSMYEDEPVSPDIEITPEAFVQDNDILLDYIITNNLTLRQTYNSLIIWAIKRNSVKIIKVFQKHEVFGTASKLQKKWFLKAIKRGNITIARFFLKSLNFDIDKSDSSFLTCAKDFAMADFLLKNGFVTETAKTPALLEQISYSNNIGLLQALLEANDYGIDLEQVILSAIRNNSVEILEFLNDGHYFSNIQEAQLAKFLVLAAVNYHKVGSTEFFLDHFDFSQIVDDKFIENIQSTEIARLFHRRPTSSTIREKQYTISDLFRYIKENNAKKVQQVFQFNHLNTNTIWDCDEKNGETPVTWAIKANSDSNMITLLVQYGADLNLPNSQGHTPLMIAVQLNNVDMVKQLLDLNCNINKPGADGSTPLILAVKFGHLDIVRILTENPKVNFDFKDKNNKNALIYAIISISVTKSQENSFLFKKIILLLLKKVSYETKSLALIYAVRYKNLEYIELLLNYEADPNYEKDGLTSLDYAIKNKDYESIELILKKISRKSKSRALHIAIKNGQPNMEIIELLLDKTNLDVPCPNTRYPEWTLLMYAAHVNDIKTAELLLAKGSNKYLIDSKNRRNALMIAAANGNYQIIKLLLAGYQKEKSEINAQDVYGNTALMYASCACCPRSIRLLIEAGADINLANYDKETPLLILAKIGEKSIYRNIIKSLKKIKENLVVDDRGNLKINSMEEEEEYNELSSDLNMSSFRRKIDNLEAYVYITRAISEVSASNPNPLLALSTVLNNKINQDFFDEKEFYAQALDLLKSLIEAEAETVFKCCQTILKNQPSAIKYIDNKKMSALYYAILQNNIAAIKAFLPYVSEEARQNALILAKDEKSRNRELEMLLMSKPSAKSCIIS